MLCCLKKSRTVNRQALLSMPHTFPKSDGKITSQHDQKGHCHADNNAQDYPSPACLQDALEFIRHAAAEAQSSCSAGMVGQPPSLCAIACESSERICSPYRTYSAMYLPGGQSQSSGG